MSEIQSQPETCGSDPLTVTTPKEPDQEGTNMQKDGPSTALQQVLQAIRLLSEEGQQAIQKELEASTAGNKKTVSPKRMFHVM